MAADDEYELRDVKSQFVRAVKIYPRPRSNYLWKIKFGRGYLNLSLIQNDFFTYIPFKIKIFLKTPAKKA